MPYPRNSGQNVPDYHWTKHGAAPNILYRAPNDETQSLTRMENPQSMVIRNPLYIDTKFIFVFTGLVFGFFLINGLWSLNK